MFKKSVPIIFVGLSVVVAMLVLGWSVFVKSDDLVQVPVVDDGNGEIIDDNPNNDDISEIDTSNWKTYQNGRYGFEFNYPLYYTLEKGTNDYALLYRTEHKKAAWSFNLTVEQNRFDSRLSFEEFVKKSVLDNCVVNDNPNGSTYCTEVTEIKPFVNENKISGYEIYLNEITEDSLNGKISNRIKGPVFAMDVFKQTQAYIHAQGIFFDFDGKKDEEVLSKQEKQKLTNQVISTLKFIEKKDDTASWRTYKNEKYGYEFKYPYEWNAVPNKYNTGTVLLGPEATEESSNGGIEYNGTLKQGQTFKDFVKEFSTAGAGSDFEVEEFINGYNVIVNIIPSTNIYILRETKIVSFENNREVFSLYFSHCANFGKYPEDRYKLDLFDQIISTFKFTKE